ncbi:MAG: ABC transporter ATP-binding protein, partial [Actinomycetaceae bacterium]|nr:ABC transporter ATP-binding protein [Actinomycetaceae bacterium]
MGGFHPPRRRIKGSEDILDQRSIKEAIFRLMRTITHIKWRVFSVLFMSLLATASSVIAPKLLGDATNVIADGISTSNNNINFSHLTFLLILVAFLYLFSNVLQFISGVIVRFFVQHIGFQLREEVEEKIHKLPLNSIDKQSRGDLLSTVTNDIDNVITSLRTTFSRILEAAYTLIGVIAIMIYLSFTLTLVSLSVLALGIIVTFFMTKKARPYFSQQWNTTARVSSIIEEGI